ncbi:pilus assembly protein TadD [Vibrio diazotrophicus]|uniref:Pilus assembly protein TadD n=1 Tax=Vibrio diazotrophicus TaxID=685 RepID=A0A2J8I4Z4_VIBDI|nr:MULTISPECIES: pilus assembly protein TadD [Vibrio]MCF7361905.1 pilus assembly protein TadD [Vibrio sp. A1-b2]PNI05551.1 pilus assembly protein TadD [Vibrio diazotrophicus]
MKNQVMIPLISLVLVLAGCVSGDSYNDGLAIKEQLLINTGDNHKLIEFYKSNLSISSEYKVKLVQIYLDTNDIQSASFYANTFSDNERKLPQFILTLARLDYMQKQYDSALIKLEQYRRSKGVSYDYYWLSGLINAEQKNYDEAIINFGESRKFGASDRSVNNNIAFIQMMQSKYRQATDILYKLYLEQPNDKKIQSNLLIASVKSNRLDIALDVLKQEHDELSAKRILDEVVTKVGIATSFSEEAKSLKAADAVKEDSSALAKVSSPRSNQNSMASSVAIGDIEHDTPRAKSDSDVSISYSTLDETYVMDVEKVNVGSNSYRIQVLATNRVIPPSLLKDLKAKHGVVYLYQEGNLKRYCVGQFDNRHSANVVLKEIEISGAFVVNYDPRRFIEL